MKVYMNRKQAEQIIIAMMTVFGSGDEESLKIVQRINNVLLYQCKQDKSHYDRKIERVKVAPVVEMADTRDLKSFG